MFTEFKRIGIKDQTVSLLQDSLINFFKQFYQKPQLDSLLLRNVSLSSGTNFVPHTLGRVYTGWKIIDINANVSIWRSSIQNNDKFLTLDASGACTVSIEVF